MRFVWRGWREEDVLAIREQGSFCYWSSSVDVENDPAPAVWLDWGYLCGLGTGQRSGYRSIPCVGDWVGTAKKATPPPPSPRETTSSDARSDSGASVGAVVAERGGALLSGDSAPENVRTAGGVHFFTAWAKKSCTCTGRARPAARAGVLLAHELSCRPLEGYPLNLRQPLQKLLPELPKTGPP